MNKKIYTIILAALLTALGVYCYIYRAEFKTFGQDLQRYGGEINHGRGPQYTQPPLNPTPREAEEGTLREIVHAKFSGLQVFLLEYDGKKYIISACRDGIFVIEHKSPEKNP